MKSLKHLSFEKYVWDNFTYEEKVEFVLDNFKLEEKKKLHEILMNNIKETVKQLEILFSEKMKEFELKGSVRRMRMKNAVIFYIISNANVSYLFEVDIKKKKIIFERFCDRFYTFTRVKFENVKEYLHRNDLPYKYYEFILFVIEKLINAK